MGGRGAVSATRGNGGTYSPAKTNENTGKLTGKKLSLGTNSVTIKGENGKTAGVVRGMSRVQSSNPQDQMMMHKFQRESGIDLRTFGMGNIYKANGNIYIFNDTKGDTVAMRLKNVNKTEYDKLVEKNKRLANAEKAGAYIINHV